MEVKKDKQRQRTTESRPEVAELDALPRVHHLLLRQVVLQSPI